MKVNGWIALETGTPRVGREQLPSADRCLQQRSRGSGSSREVRVASWQVNI